MSLEQIEISTSGNWHYQLQSLRGWAKN